MESESLPLPACPHSLPRPHMLVPRLLTALSSGEALWEAGYLTLFPPQLFLQHKNGRDKERKKNYSKMDLEMILEGIPKFGTWEGGRQTRKYGACEFGRRDMGNFGKREKEEVAPSTLQLLTHLQV